MAFGERTKTAAYLGLGLAEVFDLMEAGQWQHAEALTALLLVALEQAAHDEWRWSPAWLLTFLPEPPWQDIGRAPPRDSVRPLARLADQSWTAASIAYLRDVAVLTERTVTRTAPQPKSAGHPKSKAKAKATTKGDATPAASQPAS